MGRWPPHATHRTARDRPPPEPLTSAPARTPNEPGSTSPAVEARTIEHIPVTERHGRASDLFTVWFGSNTMLLTIATGVLATAVYGLPVRSALVALVVGNLVGAVVMALPPRRDLAWACPRCCRPGRSSAPGGACSSSSW